jgi:hypothetical protein
MDAKDKYLERCLARLFTMCGMTSPITAQGYSSGVAMSDVNFQAAKQADPVGLVNYLNKTCAYAKQRVSKYYTIMICIVTNVILDTRKSEL